MGNSRRQAAEKEGGRGGRPIGIHAVRGATQPEGIENVSQKRGEVKGGLVRHKKNHFQEKKKKKNQDFNTIGDFFANKKYLYEWRNQEGRKESRGHTDTELEGGCGAGNDKSAL